MNKLQEKICERIKDEVECNDLIFDDSTENQWATLMAVLELSSEYKIDFEDESTTKIHFNPN